MTLQDIIDIINQGLDEIKIKNDYSNSERFIVLRRNRFSYTVEPYQLLISPLYSTIPTLLQSTKFTDAFWEWMKDKGYGQKKCLNYSGGRFSPVPPQMLTGYIIECLEEIMNAS